MHKRVWAVSEDIPGTKWKEVFERCWDGYRAWFLREGLTARPTYLESVRALRKFMPELLPTYEQIVDLAGGGDITARFLSLYRPTPYMSGCSQAVWGRRPYPALIRNYDYNPSLWDATMLHSTWNGRRVIAMTDCVWGVLDGVSEAGLAVSLAFGGRRVVGDGFGIPLVLRYVLEFADSLREAVRMVRRIPSHMTYNVTIVDRRGRTRTIHVSPDRRPVVTRQLVATNHQLPIEWTEYVKATQSVEREEYLQLYLRNRSERKNQFVDRFLKPPVYAARFEKGWGTLYTAMYEPMSGFAALRWPAHILEQSLSSFRETTLDIHLGARSTQAGSDIMNAGSAG
jgi:predicted choloylglycine hydrolase